MSKRKWIMTALAMVLSFGIAVPAWAKTPSQTIGESFKLLSAGKTGEFSGLIEYKQAVDKKWLKLKKNAQYAPYWKDKSVKIKLNGGWDTTEENNDKFKITVEPADAGGLAYGSAVFNSFSILSAGEIFYFLADISYDKESLGTGSFDMNKIINNWVEIGKSDLTDLSDLYGSNKYVKTADKINEQNDLDAVKLKELAKLYNYYRPFKVAQLADGKINGKITRHFRGTINANGLKSFIKQGSKKISGLSLTASDIRQVDEIVAAVKNASLDFWTDKKTGALMRVSLKNVGTQKSTKYSPSVTATLKFTIDFTSVGEPVYIEQPNYTFKLQDVINEAMASAGTKALDAKRLSDLKQIQTALELYYTDKGAYPIGSNVTLGTESAACLNLSGWQPTYCVSSYMGMVPKDPGNSAYVYFSADGTSYTINAHLDETVNGLSGDIGATPSGIIDFADIDGIK